RRDQEGSLGRLSHRPRQGGRRRAQAQPPGRLREELQAALRPRDSGREVDPEASRLGNLTRLRAGQVPGFDLEGSHMSVLIKGGRVITAADDYIADVFIEGERISLIGESLDITADRT